MQGPPSDFLPSALDRLYGRTRHGIRPGLERIEALMRRMKAPHEAFVTLHVAGTNGKGSVCAMIEAVLRSAGLRTGIYTSPHLVRFNERFRVNGLPIDDGSLASAVAEAEAHAAVLDARAGGDGPCTFFELSTAIAFDHFRRSGVRVAVIETGMGGRWDATNVVHPLCSIITEVDIDHAEYLGNTVEAIAFEKAGIIKPGRPVVCGARAEAAVAVIEGAARERGSRLVRVDAAAAVRRAAQDWDGQQLSVETPSRSLSIRLPLLGEHQARNLAIAMAALETFEEEAGITLDERAFRKGLAHVEWPARAQVLERDPPVMLDGAHNPHAARALAGMLRSLAGRRRTFLVAGMLADKDSAGFAAALAPEVRDCWTVPVPADRARDPGELADVFRAVGLPARASSFEPALAEARAAAAAQDGAVCIAGSLYLAADVLRRMGRERLFEPGSA